MCRIRIFTVPKSMKFPYTLIATVVFIIGERNMSTQRGRKLRFTDAVKLFLSVTRVDRCAVISRQSTVRPFLFSSRQP